MSLFMRCASLAFFVFIILCSPLFSWAQKVRTVSATRQDWSGGIAGRYGTNYVFTVEFSGFETEPKPDTLWIGNEPFAISIMDPASYVPGNTKRTQKKGAIRFEINAGISHNTYANNPNENKPALHSPMPHNGVALLSYTYKGKAHFYEIKKIMKVYATANYP